MGSLKAAFLNLLRLKDRLVNFISVHGPPLKIVPQAHCSWSYKPYYATKYIQLWYIGIVFV